MAVDSFRLVVAMNLIEKEADSAAQRWDMLKLWLKKEEAAQHRVQADGLYWCWNCNLWQKFDHDNRCGVCKTARR